MTIGKAKSHDSAIGHVTGKAVYTDDQRRFEGMLTCWPVMAQHAHARLTKLDVAAAKATPGVITVLTARDIPGVNNTNVIAHDEVLLVEDEVQYWGQPLAWVVAETEDAARMAAANIVADYDVLPAILSIEEAIAADSFQGEALKMGRGDVLAALKSAEHVLEGEVFMNGQDHFYLETHASWAMPDGEGNYQLYTSTQHPSETQHVVAHVLGIASNRVVVTCLRMGGGFGGKETQANSFAAIAALAAAKTGRPARVRLKRDQDMIISGKRHPFLGRYRVGFDSQGKLLALDVDLYSDGGWSLDLSLPVLQRALFHIDNAYFIPAIEVRGRVCKTHKTSQTAFRGFGGPQGMVVIEEVMDSVARQLGLPPEQVREKNFYQEGQETHYGQQLINVRTERVWQALIKDANFHNRKKDIESFNLSSPRKKRGIAITPVKFGISFTHTVLNQAGAFVLIYTDGSIQLNHGGTEMGQGLYIKMLQVAAKSLGVKQERFRHMPTSTDKVPNTSATAASAGADLNGQAVKNACERLKARLAVVAAKMLRLNAPEDLVFADDWVFSSQQPKERVGFDAVVAQAYLEQVSLSATGFYRTPNIYFDRATGKGKPFYYFAYGAAVSEVEVDGFTGQWQLKQVDILHDVGESLNPLVDKGQIEGGFVQGMGWLTMEELVWDKKGQLRTFAPSTYKIPTISEIPQAFKVTLLKKAVQDGVIYGSKAVGEPPLMLALSVREAIRAAVAAFAEKPRAVPLASPATPEGILEAIERRSLPTATKVLGD